MQIISIDDNKNGHKSQIYGVLNYLQANHINNNNHSITYYSVKKSILDYLTYGLFKFFLSKSSKSNLYNLIDNNEIELKIVAIGSKTLFTSLILKEYGLSLGKNVKLIYLMPPTKNKALIQLIDLIFYHSYKKLRATGNQSKYVPLLIAPHNMIEDEIKRKVLHSPINDPLFKLLDNGNTKNKEDNLEIFGILIGGDAKNIVFNKKSADTLIAQMLGLNNTKPCYFLITTSRRTKPSVAKYMLDQLSLYNLRYIFYNYDSYLKNNQNTEYVNPYFYILHYANNFIITGESVSMISEVICLNKPKKVYIFFNHNFYAKRYAKFHNQLINQGYIKNSIHAIEDIVDSKNYPNSIVSELLINPAIMIAERIVKL